MQSFPEQDNREAFPSGKLPTADTGNASNPSPHHREDAPAHASQLLGEKAEKYLAESGNIEDLPDPQEEEDAEDAEKE